MKKCIAILCTIAMLCCMGSTLAFAASDNTVLLDFESSENAKTYIGSTEDFALSQGWISHLPTYSTVTGVDGNALKVTQELGTAFSFAAQVPVSGNPDFAANVATKTYLRFYFENTSENAQLGIGLTFYDATGQANASVDNLKYYDVSGKAITIAQAMDPTGGNGAGAGYKYNAVVAPGFKGWVYLELDEENLTATWNTGGITSFADVTQVELDVRLYDALGDTSVSFVFDSLELTDALITQPTTPGGETILVSNFEPADIDAFLSYNTGLSEYGITPPSYEAAKGDDGNGIRIKVDTNTASVQDFYLRDAELISTFTANVSNDKVFKFYIKNEFANSPLGVTMMFRSDATTNLWDATKVSLYNMKGKAVSTSVGNASSGAENSSILIPAGFEGYIYVPVANINKQIWGNTVASDLSGVTFIELDVRPQFDGDASGSYIVDSFALTDELPTSTADFSVIGYALAAITGCGALLFAKKRA